MKNDDTDTVTMKINFTTINHDDEIVYSSPPKPNTAWVDKPPPKNNDGRYPGHCYWCDAKLIRVPGFFYKNYDICPDCKK